MIKLLISFLFFIYLFSCKTIENPKLSNIVEKSKEKVINTQSSNEKETNVEDNSKEINVPSDSTQVEPKLVVVQPKAQAAVQTTVFTYLRVELLHIACIAIVLAAALAVLTLTLN